MINDSSMPKTEEEWKKVLTPEQYQVLRMKGTEAPGSGEYLHEKRRGRNACSLFRLWQCAVFLQCQVRFRHWLAELRSGLARRGEVC